MSKLLYAIFAHPDDEAFGVSPTLIKERHEGAEIHLIALTAGDAGVNPDNVADLGALRLEEWQQSAGIIGATSNSYLGYRDGTLCNTDIDPIVDSIIAMVAARLQNDTSVATLDFITFDPNGLSGHIDHIVASHATLLAYHRLAARFPAVAMRVRMLCITKEQQPLPNTDWRYAPAGRELGEIDETIDASEYRDVVIRCMRAHHSQRQDCESHLKNRGDTLCINHYVVIE